MTSIPPVPARDTDPVRDIAARPDADAVRLHDSIADLLASRGQWREAYRHLRAALNMIYAESAATIPEQLRREVAQLRREHAQAREQSIRDGLTASYNRRYLDQHLVILLSDAAASGAYVAIALVDLDWFKDVNDRFGHLVGDEVLRRVVMLLTEGLPRGGFCARYGGEEFVLVLPGLSAASAVKVAEQARARIEHHAWSEISRDLRVTVSIGIAHGKPAADRAGSVTRCAADAEHRLLEADTLLYAAKRAGRNAVAYRESTHVRLAGTAYGRSSVTQPMTPLGH